MIEQIATWYIIMLGLGLLNYPVTSSLLPKLKSRGYAFSKIVGLLLLGFLYWITNIFQLLPNSLFGAIAALVLIAALNGWIFIRNKDGIKKEFSQGKSYILMVELLFLISFLAASILRAMSPAASGTEKPMELAFINSILETPTFPPGDPWLSGYAISYYYFGYLMVALLARISGVIGGVAFNLGIAVWIGLICTASYGILYDLLQVYFAHRQKKSRKISRKLLWLSFLAPILLLVVSNAEVGLEMLHASGAFWSKDSEGNQQSAFWEWLDIQELNEPPAADYQWIPQRSGGNWWWRASRVISDYDAAGNFREVIDEIPAFTFYLADLHPHVLSIPFFLLVVGAGLNLFLDGENWLLESHNWKEILKRWEFWLTAVLLGSILFLNTWDFPASFGLFALTVFLRILKEKGCNQQIWIEALWKILLMAFAAVLVYLPFFLGFSSQAGGVLPSLLYNTRGVQFLVMFFPFLFLLIGYLPWSNRGLKTPDKKIIPYFLIFVLLLSLFCLLFPAVKQLSVSLWTRLQEWKGEFASQLSQAIQRAQSFAAIYGAGDIKTLMQLTFSNRLKDSSVAALLMVLLYLALRFLFRNSKGKDNSEIVLAQQKAPIHDFVHLLIFMGAGLCLIPEFIFLVDVFSDRMNTIFKFYFQAWILFSLAGSFIMVVLWNEWKKTGGVIFRIFSIMVLLICSTYTFFLYRDRIRYTNPENWTLDGTAYINWSNSGDAVAVETLKTLPYGVVVEAIGGSYSGYARIATLSGYPNVLGWPGHEVQWRGGYIEMGSRQSDIKKLYETSEWLITQPILQQYDIRYVVVGYLERNTYTVDEQKFIENLTLLSQENGTTLYEVP